MQCSLEVGHLGKKTGIRRGENGGWCGVSEKELGMQKDRGEIGDWKCHTNKSIYMYTGKPIDRQEDRQTGKEIDRKIDKGKWND